MITVRAKHIRQIKDESEMPLSAHKRWTMMYRTDIFLNNNDATSMIWEGETLLVNYASSLMGDVQTMRMLTVEELETVAYFKNHFN